MRRGRIALAAALACAGTAAYALLSGILYFFAAVPWLLYGVFALPALLAGGFLCGYRQRDRLRRAGALISLLAVDCLLFYLPFAVSYLMSGASRYGLRAIFVVSEKDQTLLLYAAMVHAAVLLWRGIAEMRRNSC